MEIYFESLIALIVGAAIGVGFGMIQQAALRRHEEQERTGKFKSGWSIMPGSGGRVSMLLIALALIQVVCPLLFKDGTQWWVSAGVAGSYGFMLFFQLRQRLAENK